MSEVEKLPRDCRLDLIGYVGELVDKFEKPLCAKVKADLQGKGTAKASGDAFEGLIVCPSMHAIEPEKFLRLYEAKKITREQFVGAISIRKEPALLAISGDMLAKISVGLPSVPQLRVSRIKTVEVTLAAAVASITKSLAEAK